MPVNLPNNKFYLTSNIKNLKENVLYKKFNNFSF